jgi:hypothetical protein
MPALASPSLMVGWFPVSPSSCRQHSIVVSRCGSEMSEGVAGARTSLVITTPSVGVFLLGARLRAGIARVIE